MYGENHKTLERCFKLQINEKEDESINHYVSAENTLCY